MKTANIFGVALATALLAGACSNPSTPAGHEGYVYHVPLVFGKMRYERSLVGPASTGVSWRLFVTNIDMRARNYKEPFDLLTSDNLNVKFEVNIRLKPKSGMVRDIVEKWGGEHWYEWNVKERLRAVIRREVMTESARNIQLKTAALAQRIQKDLEARYAGTKDSPKWLEIKSVDIGHIEFPELVTSAIQRKISKQQELMRQKFVLAKAKKEAAIEVLHALKVAKTQKIISSTLDPLYVQRKAVQVYRRLADSPNKTVIMLPNSADGTAIPLVVSRGKRKVLSAADEQLLKKMEKVYMEMARSGNADVAVDRNGAANGSDGEAKSPGDEAATPGAPTPKPAPAMPKPAAP